MDELIKLLMEKAGLSEAQTKAAAATVVEWLKHDENRKKIAAFAASAVAARVV